MKLHVSRFSCRGDNTPIPVEIEWGRLSEELQRFRIRDTHDGEMWGPGRYIEGQPRTMSGVLDIWLLVLDFDDGIRLEDLRSKWDELGLEYVWHSSWHNMQEKVSEKETKPAVHRWRAVFPLTHPVAAKDWKRCYVNLAEHLAQGHWDQKCKNTNRVYWLPAAKDGAPTFSGRTEGRTLDPNEAPDIYQEPDEKEYQPPKGGEIQPWLNSALSHIPADDYDDWCVVGMALKYEYGDGGGSLWDEWSKGSEKYPDDGTSRKWASFHYSHEIGDGDKRVTLGSIHHLAVQHGWEAPAKGNHPAWDKGQPPRTDDEAPYTGPQAVPDLMPVANPDDAPSTKSLSSTDIPGPDDWTRGLTNHFDEKKKEWVPDKSAGNLSLFISHSKGWEHAIAYDELSHCVRWRKIPLKIQGMPSPSGRLKDEHYTWVQQAARREWKMQWGKQAVIEAVASTARVHSFHPVKTYLEGLQWDGVSRLDSWLTDFMGASERAAPIGRWWLISAVARAYTPGCQVDHVLVLEGRQGLGKSTAIGILGGGWYSNRLGNLATVDGAQSLLGKWIVEIGEMDALKGMAATRVKDFITTRADDYRPSYGRNNVHRPRQCVFCGSTNEGAYLHDSTGSRRFWPVKVTKSDNDRLAKERDQLWAQARDAFLDGARWWPIGREENEALELAAEERFAGDPWEEDLEDWLPSRPGEISVSDCLDRLGLEKGRWTRRESGRVAAILRRLGYVKIHTKAGNRWIKQQKS